MENEFESQFLPEHEARKAELLVTEKTKIGILIDLRNWTKENSFLSLDDFEKLITEKRQSVLALWDTNFKEKYYSYKSLVDELYKNIEQADELCESEAPLDTETFDALEERRKNLDESIYSMQDPDITFMGEIDRFVKTMVTKKRQVAELEQIDN